MESLKIVIANAIREEETFSTKDKAEFISALRVIDESELIEWLDEVVTEEFITEAGKKAFVLPKRLNINNANAILRNPSANAAAKKKAQAFIDTWKKKAGFMARMKQGGKNLMNTNVGKTLVKHKGKVALGTAAALGGAALLANRNK